MNQDHRQVLHRLNCLAKDLDALYHQAARQLGVADSVLIVAYTLHEKGDGCFLYDIYSDSGVSKQTINSAMRKLEGDGLLYLTQDKGKMKRVWLTDSGRDFVSRTAKRLFGAECRALDGWTEDELAEYVSLMTKYNQCFRRELDHMEDEADPTYSRASSGKNAGEQDETTHPAF